MNKKQHYDIYINKDAGTVRHLGREALEKRLADSAIKIRHLFILSAPELLEKIAQIDENDKVLIGGGDGTIRSCAKHFIAQKTCFGILPLGTMNLLAQDLKIPNDLEAALNAYAQDSTTMSMDVGIVNEDVFLCCAGIGVMPSASQERESARKSKSDLLVYAQLASHVFEHFDHDIKFEFIIDGKATNIKSPSVVVSNNQYEPDKSIIKKINFTRERLQDGLLGLYSIAPKGFFEKMNLLWLMKLGNWKKTRAIKAQTAKQLSINIPRQRQALISLDGETQNMTLPLDFSIQRKALHIIVPKEL
jgi:diacylglycerol kinase family enzyme